MFDTSKRIAWIFALGLVTGGYGVHRLEAAPILQMQIDGWCSKEVFRTILILGVGWFNCQDAAIAHDIQVRDAENSAADDAAIFADLKAKDQVRQAKKGARK